jgi:DNA replication and repair protein RecF
MCGQVAEQRLCRLFFFLPMLITHLNLSNFRNFSHLEVRFGEGVNVFFGDNGSGKTNLLEAIFVLCLGRSQRRVQDSVLVRDEQEVYRLEGDLRADGREREVAVAYQRGGRKKITLDGIPSRLTELFETFCAVSAGPEDSEILSGPPSARRGFLDLYLSQYSRSYLDHLKDYDRVLAQKNAALKSHMDPMAFNQLLVSIGARIMKARMSFIDQMSQRAAAHHGKIADGEKLALAYEPSIPIESGLTELADFEATFEQRLQLYAPRELGAETALIGPHRDEIGILINNEPARTHGSQGQWRTAAVSLKLAVYELLKERRGAPPALLLDEIFAELDPKRCVGLIESFQGFSQLFLTTASEPPEPLRTSGRRFRIAAGTLQELS